MVKTPVVIDSKRDSSFWPLFFKAGALSLLFASLMLLVTGLVVGGWGYWQWQKFSVAANLDQATFLDQVKNGWHSSPLTEKNHKNILLLGLDSTEERSGSTTLTDTIMLLSIDFEQGLVSTLPLPRDLWSETYQTKINALYVYGQDRYPDKPEQFTREVIENLTGLPIHHTIILTLDQLETLIDLVGGVEIKVKQGFTDALYPRVGVDVLRETDPAILYETVIFESGNQQLSGKRALQYIRSRQSNDEQGHDLARGVRQQEVITALLGQLTNAKLLIRKPELASKLYNFYDRNFAVSLPLKELVATVKAILPHRKTLSFANHQLTTTADDPIAGVLSNPPRLPAYQYQWVYLINNKQQFQTAVQEMLLFSHN